MQYDTGSDTRYMAYVDTVILTIIHRNIFESLIKTEFNSIDRQFGNKLNELIIHIICAFG